MTFNLPLMGEAGVEVGRLPSGDVSLLELFDILSGSGSDVGGGTGLSLLSLGSCLIAFSTSFAEFYFYRVCIYTSVWGPNQHQFFIVIQVVLLCSVIWQCT